MDAVQPFLMNIAGLSGVTLRLRFFDYIACVSLNLTRQLRVNGLFCESDSIQAFSLFFFLYIIHGLTK
jgi:hypothetical protein